MLPVAWPRTPFEGLARSGFVTIHELDARGLRRTHERKSNEESSDHFNPFRNAAV